MIAAVVDADVSGSAVVVAVGRDRAHDATAEDESQEADGDQLGGPVAGEAPDPAGSRWWDWCRCSGCGWGFCGGGSGLLGGGLWSRLDRVSGGWLLRAGRGRCGGLRSRRGRRVGGVFRGGGLLGRGLRSGCGRLPRTRRGRCVGGQRSRCLVGCRPGCLRVVFRRLRRWRRLSLLAHVLNDAPFG
jgi:hypothetical protein